MADNSVPDTLPFDASSPSVVFPVSDKSPDSSTEPLKNYDFPSKDEYLTGTMAKGLENFVTFEQRQARDQEQTDKELEARQKHLMSLEGAEIDRMRPWDQQQQSAKYSHNLWEQFGSPGFVIGMLASAFTGAPMTAALNAGAAAMNAVNQGDEAAYRRAFDTWKFNTDLALHRADLESKQFSEIGNLRSSSRESWHARMEAALAQYNDERKLFLLRNGFNQELEDAIAGQDTSRLKAQQARDDIVINDARTQLIRDQVGDSKDPKKYIQAAKEIDAALAEKGPEGAAMLNVIMSSEYQQERDYNKRNKMLTDVVKKMNEAKYGGRSASNAILQKSQDQTDAWAEEQRAGGKEPAAQEYNDKLRENLAANRTADQPVQAKRTDIQAKDAETRLQALQEKIRSDEANEAIKREAAEKKASGGGISGNRADQIERQIDAYDNNIKLIDNIKKSIEKYHYSVGLAGKALRAGERFADVLAGSTETDRVQIMRDLERLKLGASRLLLDADGRPLAASEHRIDDIIGGGNYGDLTANTLRSLDEVETDYKNMREQHNKRLPEKQRREPTVTVEQPTVTDKPASWEDVPSTPVGQ